jgi:F0F1-type ATP synthase assembly protein I
VPAGGAHLGQGLNLTVEFLTAILTWGGIGWLLDRWLETAPWLMVAGLVIGNACGIYLIWLHSRSEEEVEQARQRDAQKRLRRKGQGAGR